MFILKQKAEAALIHDATKMFKNKEWFALSTFI